MSSALIRLLRTEGFRLSAIYAAAFAVSVAMMGTMVLLMTGHALRDQVVRYARADIAAIQDGYRSAGVREAHEVIGQRMAAPGASDYFLLQRNGARLIGNLAPMAPRTGIVTLPAARAGHEILGVGAFLASDIYVFSGSDLSHVDAAQNDLLHALSWVLGTGLVLAVIGGALVSRSFLRRTDAMARACHAIMDGDMRARIPMRGSGDELDRLAGAINAMLDRIAALMENLRQVTNDIAHDLRTPVTHLRARLERALDEPGDDAIRRQTLRAAIEKSDEILAMFAALLRIAQIEGGARRAAFAMLEMGALLAHMRELFGAVAEEEDHRLSVAVAENAAIRGDRELLIQLFSNLVENAILHTPPGTAITLSLAVRGGHAIVRVSDDGPGVPHAEHQKLFQRLYRREASRNRPGHGLGLSLVAAIAELHGARLRIAEHEAQGLCVELSFPLPGDHTNSQP